MAIGTIQRHGTIANGTGTSQTVPSFTAPSGGMFFCVSEAASDEGTVSAPASPSNGGSFTATWTAIAQRVGGSSISLGQKVWYATDHSGTGTVNGGTWTNATLTKCWLVHVAADGALTFIAGGSTQGTDGTNTATFTDASNLRSAALYCNAAIVGDIAFSPTPANTVEVEEILGTESIADSSWGYNITATIPTTLGSTHGTVTRRVCIAWGIEEEASAGETLTATFAVSWDIRDTVEKTVAVSWDIRETRELAVPVGWDIHSTVEKTEPVSWAIRALEELTTPISWDVLGQVTKTTPASWNIRTTVEKTVPISWNVRASVEATSNISWDIRGSVTKIVPISWDIEGEGEPPVDPSVVLFFGETGIRTGPFMSSKVFS